MGSLFKINSSEIPVYFFQPTTDTPVCHCGDSGVHYHYEKNTILDILDSFGDWVKNE